MSDRRRFTTSQSVKYGFVLIKQGLQGKVAGVQNYA